MHRMRAERAQRVPLGRLGSARDSASAAVFLASDEAGAVIGLGCTVGHGLSGIAALSLGSLLSLPAIFAGATLAVWLESDATRVRKRAAARA